MARQRVSRHLEKKVWLHRDMENTYLLLDGDDDDALLQLQGHSVTYRIAFGPQMGRKVLSLAPPQESARVAKQAGFSLHAGVMADSHQTELREWLCRYISRPAATEKRLAFTKSGKVRYERKTPSHEGTTHVLFKLLDFIARLVALAWQAAIKTRVNLMRFDGPFAPNSKHRSMVGPGKWGKERKPTEAECAQDKTIEERRNAMTWMQRLKRVFNGAAFGSTLNGANASVVILKSLHVSKTPQ